MRRGLTFFTFFYASCLCALPSGGQIFQGDASISSSKDLLHIQAHGQAILHWDQFDIASHESVCFIQSHDKLAILNRVTSGSASQILGSLEANCPIYLVNPRGIFIGSNAHIDTAGFLASTADISNEAFWQHSNMLFEQKGEGSIVNFGSIHSIEGDVYLIARTIDNRGQIEAPQGIISLVTNEVMINPRTKECMFIRINESISSEENIYNSGSLQALAVQFQTQSPYERAICHKGSIEALTTLENKGRIYLVADRGGCVVDAPLTADNGKIEIVANSIHLTNQAIINVSAQDGAGTIQMTSSSFCAEPETHLVANAVVEGNGGCISLWADRQFVFEGLAEACGGAQGGDGGSIHFSSKGSFTLGDDRPIVNATAPNGSCGTVIFDPKFVTISSEGFDSATGNTFDSDPTGSVIISGSTLQTALDSANVVIQANTDIIFQDTVSTSTAGTSLTFQAGRSIVFNGDLTLNEGDFAAIINDSGAMVADRDEGPASFQMGNLGHILTQGGSITLDVGTFGSIQEGEISIQGGTMDAGGGNISIKGFARQDHSDYVYGVSLGGFSIIQTTGSGTLSLHGVGGNGTNGNVGVYLSSFTCGLQTDAGGLSLEGIGGGNGLGTGNVGIYSAAAINSTSIGAITLNGVGGIGTHGNMGICLSQGLIDTVHGDISLSGVGGGTGAMNFGVRLESGAQCNSSGSGLLTLTGTSGNGKNNNHGIILSGGSLTASDGAISMTGIGRGSQNYNYGIRIETGSQCISSGTAPISLQGQNMTGLVGNAGISIAGGDITSVYGDIAISGTSNGTATLNQGVRVESGQIASSGTGVGAAQIHITGVGGAGTDYCNGVTVQGSNAVITSMDGNIILEGTALGRGVGNQPILIDPSATVAATGAGTVTYIEH